MIKVTNKYIADYLAKETNTINTWKKRNPKLLNLCKLGAFCVLNKLDMYKLEKLLKINDILSEQDKDLIIPCKDFFEHFTFIDNSNYVYENLTGKKYIVNVLDDLHNMVQLIEPKNYENNVEAIQKKLNKFKDDLIPDN